MTWFSDYLTKFRITTNGDILVHDRTGKNKEFKKILSIFNTLGNKIIVTRLFSLNPTNFLEYLDDENLCWYRFSKSR